MKRSEVEGMEILFYSKSKKVVDDVNSAFDKSCVYAYSWKGVMAFLRARILIFTHGSDDFFPFILRPRKKIIINLFHAIALKKIGISIKGANREKLLKEAKLIDYFICSSNEEKDLLTKELLLDEQKVVVTGMPRNDFLIQGKENQKTQEFREKFSGKKRILYAPTFRDNGESVVLFPFEDKDLPELNSFLVSVNAVILVRCHQNEYEALGDSVDLNYSNIVYCGSAEYPDVQDILNEVDIIVTDYSSVALDFLLTLKPLIFVPYDYESYAEERGFMFEYDTVAAGPKVLTMADFTTSIKNYIENGELDCEIRLKQRDRLHRFMDGKSAQRIVEIIRSNLKQ